MTGSARAHCRARLPGWIWLCAVSGQENGSWSRRLSARNTGNLMFALAGDLNLPAPFYGTDGREGGETWEGKEEQPSS